MTNLYIPAYYQQKQISMNAMKRKRNGVVALLMMLTLSLVPLQAQRYVLTAVAPEGSTYLTLSPSDSVILLTAASHQYAATVKTNLKVNATASQTWCGTSLENGTLNISVPANTENDVRETTVALTAKDGRNASIRLQQLGLHPQVIVAERAVSLINNDTRFTLTLAANTGFTQTLPAWVKQTGKTADRQTGAVCYEYTAEAMAQPGLREDKIILSPEGGTPVTVSVSQSFEGYPRFAVMCDLHFGNQKGEGPLVKVPQALRHLLSKGSIDALFVCGDLTDGGTQEQYADFKRVFANTDNIPAGVKVYCVQGDHDNYDADGHENFRTATGQPLDQFIDIKGYPFILVSIRGRRGYDGYGNTEREFLKKSLARAAEDYPGKPIFVFTHVPAYGTVYGSCAGEGGWGSSQLTDILEQYPQIVLFTGHSHFPLGDPRSISQNVFTSVNAGSSTYSEIEPDAVDEGIHPDQYDRITEGLIVQADGNSNLEIQRWDTYSNEEILPRWHVTAPHDGTAFTYKDRTGGKAPWFAETDRLTVSDITEDGCTMTFPQATDDEAVHRYVVEITGKDGRAVSSRTCFSGYYLNSRQPKSFTMTFNGIAEETELTARVRAIDSYNNESAPLVSETFRIAAYTPDPDTERPTADLLDVVWDSNGEATDISEQNSTITHGTELPVMADKASENGHVPHFSGNSQCYYRVDYAGNAAMKTAFQNAFSLETVYTPDNLSNMCVLSGQENGFAGIEQASGGQICFYAYVGDGYKILKSNVTATAGETYHVVATYDAAAGVTRLFVNGKPAGEMAAKGTMAFPGNENAHWIAIGGDASTGNFAQYSLQGTVSRARIYAKALSRDEARLLYLESITSSTNQ